MSRVSKVVMMILKMWCCVGLDRKCLMLVLNSVYIDM